MKNNIYLFYLLIVLLAATTVANVSATDYIVVNSRDWHDVYLSGVYAGYSGRTLIFFENLGEASLKTQLIAQDSNVLIFESSTQAVVKNYDSYLSARGVRDTHKILFDSYVDLQYTMYNRLRFQENTQNLVEPNKFALFYSEFGIEPVASVGVLYDTRSWPMFVNRDIIQSYPELEKERLSFAAGHFPIRLLTTPLFKKIDVVYSGKPGETTAGIATLNPTSNSGVITRIDRIDPQMLGKKVPTYVYYGSVGDVAALIANTNTKLFEVISSDTADISKSIEAASGRDLQLLVKYARGYTNLQGYEGQLIDLDTISFNYPRVGLRLDQVTYYASLGRLTLTYTNTGTEDVKVLSTVEFANTIVTDEFSKTIPAEQTITIPYDVEVNSAQNTVAINALYGESEPLTTNLLDPNGQPIIRTTVTRSDELIVNSIVINDVWLDDNEGVLYVDAQNTQAGNVKTTLQIRVVNSSVTLGSKTVEFAANSQGTIDVPVPYVNAETLSAPLEIYAYYGAGQTVFTTNQSAQVTKIVSAPSESNIQMYLIIIAVVVIILLVFIFVRMRQRRGF